MTSVDCPDVVNLAIGLGVQNSFLPLNYTSTLSNSCCSVEEIECDANSRVTSISWAHKGLNGKINGSSIPPLIERLHFGFNSRISGVIDDINWPDTLYELNLDDNMISGGIPLNFPVNFLNLRINGNNINGTIPNNWPTNIIGLGISRNDLDCDISNIRWPVRLERLHLNGNSCIGDVGSIPASLVSLFLGWTQDNPSRFNKITGTLVLNGPAYLDISNTFITDLIISDTRDLESGTCNLSSTPLLGNPNIVNLTTCTVDGLYRIPDRTTTVQSKRLSASMKNRTASVTLSNTNAVFISSGPSTHSISYSTQNIYPDSTFSIYSSTNTALPNDGDSSIADPNLIIIAVAAFVAICIAIFVAGKLIKNPRINSKFGRKNSFGTLNTIVSKK